MVWNHGLVSATALAGTLLGYIKRRRWKIIICFFVASSVIFALSLIYLVPTLTQFQSSQQNDQEYYFWHTPLFIPFYLGILVVGFPIAIFKFVQLLKHKPLSPIDKLSIATIASTAVMIPMWADRWLQYCTIPLALLILSQASTSSGNTKKIWYTMIILFYFINGTFALSVRLLLQRI